MLAEKFLVYANNENAPNDCQEVAHVDDGIIMLSEKSLLLLMAYACWEFATVADGVC